MLLSYFLVVFLPCCVLLCNLQPSTGAGRFRTCPLRYDCVAVARCPRTASLLHEARDLPTSLDLLRLYMCGLRDGVVEVCCHQTFTISLPEALSDDASVEREDQVRAPNNDSITGHPSLGLVNQHDCGASIRNRIVGGEDTIPGEFPWLTLLQYQMSDGRLDFLCGGSLISNRHILTAAHCIPPAEDPFKQLVGVRLGEHNVRSEQDCVMNGIADEEGVMVCAVRLPKDYKIFRTVVHPQFESTGVYKNDIAVIQLKKKVLIEPQFVVPVCLPTQDPTATEESLEGSRLEVAGWGVTGSGLWTSDVLLKVTVPYVSRASCERQVGMRLLSSHLCAGGVGGRSPCSGDSGGPLMKTAGDGRRARVCYQVGIVSVAIGSCEAAIPGVYTRVRPFMRWILDNIQE